MINQEISWESVPVELEKYSYFYDDFGTLLSVKDNVNNTITSYSTDEDGIEYTQERKNNSLIHSYYNNGSSFVEYLNGSEKETEYARKKLPQATVSRLLTGAVLHGRKTVTTLSIM